MEIYFYNSKSDYPYERIGKKIQSQAVACMSFASEFLGLPSGDPEMGLLLKKIQSQAVACMSSASEFLGLPSGDPEMVYVAQENPITGLSPVSLFLFPALKCLAALKKSQLGCRLYVFCFRVFRIT